MNEKFLTLIDPTVALEQNVAIEPFVLVKNHCYISENVFIQSHVKIDAYCQIGARAIIKSGVKIGQHAKIGKDVVIGENAVIDAHIFIGNGLTIPPCTHVTATYLARIESQKERDNHFFVHPRALVETEHIGKNTRIWANAHILSHAKIGADCNICDLTFVENDVIIGNRVTIKSGVYLWDGLRVEDDVFIGPSVSVTNDLYPRSKHYPEKFKETWIKKGASIGANATLLPGITIGEYAMIGAGAVVTQDIPAHAVVVGNPGKIVRIEKGENHEIESM